MSENAWISIKNPLKFVPNGPINNIPALVQTMPGRQWFGTDEATSHCLNQMLVSLLTHMRHSASMSSPCCADRLNSPHKGPVINAENVSIWWRHHGYQTITSTSISEKILNLDGFNNWWCFTNAFNNTNIITVTSHERQDVLNHRQLDRCLNNFFILLKNRRHQSHALLALCEGNSQTITVSCILQNVHILKTRNSNLVFLVIVLEMFISLRQWQWQWQWKHIHCHELHHTMCTSIIDHQLFHE